MRYKKAFLKAIALITAFSVAFVSEGAGFTAVIAAPSYAASGSADSADSFENNFITTASAEDFSAHNFIMTASAADPGKEESAGSGSTGNGDGAGSTENGSGDTGTPGESGNHDNPDDPDNPDNPDNPDDPDNPDNPDDPDNPDNPDDSDNLEEPDNPDDAEELEEEDEELEVENEELEVEADYGEPTKDGNCGDNLTWAYYGDTKTLVISGTGAMQNYNSNGGAPWSDLEIEELVIEEGVTSIGNYAFKYNNSRGMVEGISLRLPAMLTLIGYEAFDENTKIAEIYIAEDSAETRKLTIDTYAFWGCSALESIHFPEDLTELEVGSGVYSRCANLEEVNIPGGLGHITKNMCFDQMTSLKRIKVEEGITAIDGGALPIGNLEQIQLPSTLKEIAENLFYSSSVKAHKLEHVYPTAEGWNPPEAAVVLPEGITSINHNAFRECISLTGEVRLPASLTVIGQSAFEEDSNITKIHIAEGSAETRELTIAEWAFWHCGALENIHFPKNLTELKVTGVEVYTGCTSLKEVIIPGSLGHITTAMGFQRMSGVERIKVEEGITAIDGGALPQGSSAALEQVQLPSGLTEIADELFSGASHLKYVYPIAEGWNPPEAAVVLPEGITSIGYKAFYNCGSLAGEVRLPASLTLIGRSAFDMDSTYSNITKVYIAESGAETRKLTIDRYGFYDCRSLETIHFPEELTELEVGFEVYIGCTNLKEVTIPGGLGHITQKMGFNQMPSVERIKVEKGITAIDTGALPQNYLVEIQLPSGLTEIANELFSGASRLKYVYPTAEGWKSPDAASEVVLPENVKSIGNYAFNGCSSLTGDLVLPRGITNIGYRAFQNCSGLATDLYLPDRPEVVGDSSSNWSAFGSCTGLTTLHTSLAPVGMPDGAAFPTSICTLWFRGTDDRETVTVDGKSIGWAPFLNHSSLSSVNKIYIDTTVKHLTAQSFWEKCNDVTFVGPNVVTLDRIKPDGTGGDIFAKAPTPLCALGGTYYVTEEGALYALNATAGTATLAYCPPDVTELYIPAAITVSEDLSGAGKGQYARTYRVTGVAQHAVMAASALETVTAENPRQITLNAYAFADCPTLSRVNGVTTQKAANALFGVNGTPAIKKAFVNTGLDADDEPEPGRGKPMRSLTYNNPSVGRLTVNIRRSGNMPEYRGDAYRLLTGEGIAIDLKAEAYGTGSLQAPFRIYLEASNLQFQGIKTGVQSHTFESQGNSYTTEVKTSYDRISGCYCISFSLPAGATWTWTGAADTGGETVMYPGRISGGGDLCIWGEVLDYTQTGSGGGDAEDDDLFGGFSGEADYTMVDWTTKRNLYELKLEDKENQAKISDTTHKPYFFYNHGSLPTQYVYRDGSDRNISSTIGKDPVTSVRHRYTVILPAGMTWADEEKLKPSPQGTILSVSEDRRTLVYEYVQKMDDSYEGIRGYLVQTLGLGSSDASNPCIVISDEYDFYQDLGQKIEYRCEATVYYTYSEPDQMQPVTAYEYLKPTDAGTVDLKRKYEFPDNKRGRGLAQKISFVAENRGIAEATVDLDSITDEVCRDNGYGYLYLTPQQMAEAILDDNVNLKLTQIEIADVTLYQGDYDFPTHRGTDGEPQVRENFYNTYHEPSPAGASTLVLTVNRAGAEDFSITELTLTVNGGEKREIPLSAEEGDLAENIEEALQAAGYLIPTGIYKITWTATEAAREHKVAAYTDPKNWQWEIGSYHATVKPDYLQGHRWLTSDSLGSFGLFSNDYSLPTAKAVFSLGSDSSAYTVEKTTRDVSYQSSTLNMSVRSIDSMTGEEVLVGIHQSQWICPGVVLVYRIDYRNGNSIPFGDIPFMQEIDVNQCLLAPCDRNEALAGQGYETITFRGRDYYKLMSADAGQELAGVWLGSEEGDFYAESVSIAGRGEDAGERKTRIYWYEEKIGPYQGGNDQRIYRFYAYVTEPETAGERPAAGARVYANDYYQEGAYSTRLYNQYSAGYRSEVIAKDMLVDPELAGTAEEEAGQMRSTYIGVGAKATYRLAFDEYWIGDYTLSEGELYDLLPRTYGTFAWELGRNVEVKYALKERIVESGQKARYELYQPEPGEDFAKITLVEEPVNGAGEPVEQYKLSFGDFTIPYNRTLYIYVTLTFPEEREVWDAFAEVADVYIYNTLYYQDNRSSLSHMIARPTQAFLKTGMYGTDGDPYGYVYCNSDEATRTVKYYLVVYNHGKGYLYLNPVHIQIPEGFTLKDPPKTLYNGWPDWNLYDVSVTDEEAPDRISRMSIGNVGVTSPKEGEAVLDIRLEAPLYVDAFDPYVGKYFLRPGQYVAAEIKFDVDGYQNTKDNVELPAAMPIDDSHHVGKIARVQGVDAHRSGYLNSNEGIPEFWEDNETAVERGFTIPECADTGKWVASEMKMSREDARPGVVKHAPVLKKVAEGEVPYDPQEGAAMEHPVKWETKLVNGGTNSLTDYRVKDSVQWPYVFEGEVKLTSQISRSYDRTFTITRKIDYVRPEGGGDPVERVDRNVLLIGGQEIKIAASREEAFAEDSGCFAVVFNGAKVYFYKEDVFGDYKEEVSGDEEDMDRRLAETMEFDFTEDRGYGVGPASYRNGNVVENDRTLSYWTRYDLSRKNESSRSSYANRIVMQPRQPYTKADVCRGTAIDADGNPVKNAEDKPDGIQAFGYVSVNTGQSTAAWMKVEENKAEGVPDIDVSDDIADLLTRENKILLGDSGNTVTYTMNVLNHVADPNETVDNEDNRRYSIRDMVIINTLPYVGDKMPFNSKVARDSDYEIYPDSSAVRLYYYDNADVTGGEGDTEPVYNLHVIDASCYQILYSEKENVVSKDWYFNDNSGAGWNGTIPDNLRADWKIAEEFEAEFGDITRARSIRIEIKEPNTDFDALADKQDYRSLMKGGRTIVVKYEARVRKGVDAQGQDTPTPGQTAWNSFGYRFDRFDGAAAMEASSIRSGVQIPSIPILYEKLIDYDLNPYKNPGKPVEFTFTIDRKEGLREDGTTRPAQQLRFSVTVGTDESENNRDLRSIRENPEITWWRPEGDLSFFWEDGASYTVKQVTAPEELPLFSVKVNGQLTSDFVYDAMYEPVIVFTNQSRVWSSLLYKMHSDSKGWDPTNEQHRENIQFLPGALFGLYTEDEDQKIDKEAIQAEGGDRAEWWLKYRALLNEVMEVTYGDDPETAVTLYLKDYGVTDENGEIRWLHLEDDTYYVRELDPPFGYKLDEAYRPITRINEVLSVYDEPGIRFPITGGGGTFPLYITGGVLIAVNGIYGGTRKRRKQRRKEKAGSRRITPVMAVKILRRVVQIRREKAGSRRITPVMAVKILSRVVQIRREKRPERMEKRAQSRKK